MPTTQGSITSLPFPSRWGISTVVGGRPLVSGVLTITSVSGHTVTGTASFRGTPLQITGYWDENTKQLRFESPFASFVGQLQLADDATARVRHFILSGRLVMKPPSLQAGESGNWIATMDAPLTGAPIFTNTLPPVGAFLTSDLLR